jgi:hypothetical protein
MRKLKFKIKKITTITAITTITIIILRNLELPFRWHLPVCQMDG